MSSKDHKKQEKTPDVKAGSTASLRQQFGGEPDAPLDVDVAEQDDTEGGEEKNYLSYNDLQKKLSEAEEKANDSWERLLRMKAEAENTNRRVKLEVEDAHKYGLKKLVLELLPILDGLEGAVVAHADEERSTDSLLEGVHLTLKMFLTALNKFGVEEVNPQAMPFNPELHQAVSTQEDNTLKSGTVVKVLQKGYLLNSRLIRPALVIVAK